MKKIITYQISFILGIAFSQYNAVLIPKSYLWLSFAVLLLFCILSGHKRKHFFIVLLCFILACLYLGYRADNRLSDVLDPIHHNKTSFVKIEVSSLINYGESYLQFDARVLESRPSQGIPKHLRILWPLGKFSGPYTPPDTKSIVWPAISPGQIWEMSLNLKPPTSYLNLGSSDRRNYLFANQISALGTVKGEPKLLNEASSFSFFIVIEKVRTFFRERLQYLIGDRVYAPVLIALVIGDQQGIIQEHWQLFNQAGITHLVSISGTHITMLAMLGSLFAFKMIAKVKTRAKFYSEFYALHYLAMGSGVIIAFLYSLLAGWGVPAQRSFLMLLVFFLNFIFNLNWSVAFILMMAAWIILVLDPWALIAPGFYLSFGAIVILTLVGRVILKEKSFKAKCIKAIKIWLKAQLGIFLILSPILIYFFHEISLISPIVNAYAIFIIGSLVTPATLFLAIFSVFEFLDPINLLIATIIHGVLAFCLEISKYLTLLPWALLDISQAPLYLSLLSIIAGVLLFIPKISPVVFLLFISFLPLLHYQPRKIEHGFWHAYFIDIGQGSAVLVQTKNHNILYDSGLRAAYNYESGQRTILPFLKYLGVKQLDYIVLTHSDLDHTGGFAEIIKEIPVTHVYASFKVDEMLKEEERKLKQTISPKNKVLTYEGCSTKIDFELDGVSFKFLWPKENYILKNKAGNELSCVLSVNGLMHKLLLTGDIGKQEEQQLIHNNLLMHDVVMAGHHGSTTSSSLSFIEGVQAKFVVSQSGHFNRFNHPREIVVKAWEQAGSTFFDSQKTGMIIFKSNRYNLNYEMLKERYKKYWH